jgi:cyclopropane-fatty-acyl-phospholipid synthase
MPALDTLLWFQRELSIDEQWTLEGTHHARTANDWLRNQDANAEPVLAILTRAYGEHTAALWRQRWRMFWMACAETFAYRGGQEWLVAHYRFVRRSR